MISFNNLFLDHIINVWAQDQSNLETDKNLETNATELSDLANQKGSTNTSECHVPRCTCNRYVGDII